MPGIRQKSMCDLAKSSAEFVGKFAALSNRLAGLRIVTHTIELHWGSFGHFSLIVMKNQEAVRFDYDGRDSYIRVEASPVREHSYPNEWKELLVKGIDNLNDAATSIYQLNEKWS